MSADKVKMGMAFYGTVVYESQTRTLTSVKSDMTVAIWDSMVAESQAGTETGLGLQYVHDMLVNDGTGQLQVIVVVTDGGSTNFQDTVAKSQMVGAMLSFKAIFKDSV